MTDAPGFFCGFPLVDRDGRELVLVSRSGVVAFYGPSPAERDARAKAAAAERRRLLEDPDAHRERLKREAAELLRLGAPPTFGGGVASAAPGTSSRDAATPGPPREEPRQATIAGLGGSEVAGESARRRKRA